MSELVSSGPNIEAPISNEAVHQVRHSEHFLGDVSDRSSPSRELSSYTGDAFADEV